MRTIRCIAGGLFLLLPLFAFTQNPLVGTYLMDVPAEGGGQMTIKLDIKPDGTYLVDLANDGTVDVQGNYEINADQLSITDSGGRNACLNQKGVYKFTVDAAQMTMEVVSDSCEGRRGPGKMMWRRV